jgi:5-methylcytosine-specific restriction protein B
MSKNVAEIDSIVSRSSSVEILPTVPSADLKKCLAAYQNGLIKANLFYDLEIVLRLLAATLTKRFCILTGLAGSGKTKLGEAFAMWLCESADQYRIVAVGADWTSNENLLGYADALKAGQYRAPVNGALELIIRAQADIERPYFLILDEMNLSHVERYFADFLSAMESDNAPLSLHGAASALTLALDEQGAALVPAKLALPANLFIIGTVNVDETTYMFSPKVLDRANVIEFRATANQMSAFLSSPTGVNLKSLEAQGTPFASAFVQRAQADADIANLTDTAGNKLTQKFKEDLLGVFDTLTLIGAEFGFRTAKEIARFMVIHKELSGPDWAYRDALDAQVLQKLMPKLHGSARKLSGVLKALEEFANAQDLPLTLEKVLRMQQRLARDGFTSFAEA